MFKQSKTKLKTIKKMERINILSLFDIFCNVIYNFLFFYVVLKKFNTMNRF